MDLVYSRPKIELKCKYISFYFFVYVRVCVYLYLYVTSTFTFLFTFVFAFIFTCTLTFTYPFTTGAEALANALQQNSSLASLFLTENGVGDPGACALSNALIRTGSYVHST